MFLLLFTILLLISLLFGCGLGLIRLSSPVGLSLVVTSLAATDQAHGQAVGNRLNLRDLIMLMIGRVSARADAFAGRQVIAYQALRSAHQAAAYQFVLQEISKLQRAS